MSLQEKLLKELVQVTKECNKIDQIKKSTNELQEICDLLDKQKKLLHSKIRSEEDLTKAEKESLRSNSERYITMMEKLRELVLENDDQQITVSIDLSVVTPY
ncbi:MAG TPA: hypothetical protein VK705_00590 [Ferruginibacter sp.]|jgi:hypothetical protein|nr:hypothetical protein [Ferruginibacter sp.]